jgi:hypothetical protein
MRTDLVGDSVAVELSEFTLHAEVIYLYLTGSAVQADRPSRSTLFAL